MKTEKKSRSFNFLIELLISCLFFALASILCVQLFVKGKERGELAQAISTAALEAQSVAEQLRSYQGEELANWLGCSWQQEKCVLSFDAAWQLNEDEAYRLEIEPGLLENVVSDWQQRSFTVTVTRIRDQRILVSLKTTSLWEEQP